MGHDEHFLSRLDRLDMPNVELALSLYRDTELLRFLLETAKVPDGAERVALCLSDESQGPYLVLTREGRFVTCLAEGMVPRGLHLVPRARLDSAAQRVEVLRARLDAARRKVGDESNVNRFLQRIFNGGEDLSREEFVALCAWQPVMQRKLLRAMMRSGEELAEMRPVLAKVSRPNAQERALMRRYWDSLWTLGHLHLLLGIDDPKTFYADLPAQIFASLEVPAPTLTWSAARQGLSGLAARGAWFAGRLGKVVAGDYKRAYYEAFSIPSILNTGLGLVAIGTTHSRMTAEIAKALDPGSEAPTTDTERLARPHKNLLAEVFSVWREHPSVAGEMVLDVGRDMAFKIARGARSPRALRFERADDIPDEVAKAIAARAMFDTLNDADSAMFACVLTAHCAGWKAEDFFLPEKYVPTFHLEWTHERTVELIRPMRRYYKPDRKTVRAKVVPGRNDDCSCGSGKKYKKCCASPVTPR